MRHHNAIGHHRFKPRRTIITAVQSGKFRLVILLRSSLYRGREKDGQVERHVRPK